MKTSERLMRNGQKIMDQANRLERASGPVQVAVCNNRGWSTTDAMGFSGLCQYALGKLVSWFGF